MNNIYHKKLTFYIDKFCILNDESKINLDNFISIKRRLSNMDKAVICAIDSIFDNSIEEIIFSSDFGEFERLDKIIEEYKLNNEASPMKFSASVHNYSIGSFNYVKKLNIPYQALSSGDDSISMGLIKSIVSKKNKVLFCYGDYIENKTKCVGMVISKEENNDSNMIELEFNETRNKNENEYEALIEFLDGGSDSFKSEFYTLRKI